MNAITHPTQFELAMLAATVSHGLDEDPLRAVGYAWRLWCDAGEVVRRGGGVLALLHERSIYDPAVVKGWRESGSAPAKFPATLDNFLRLIVKGKTPADSTKRLRDFFRYEQTRWPQLYGEPAGRIAEIKAADQAGGYFTDFKCWYLMASGYEGWWEDQKSLKASASGKKRKPRS
jgi:hypothetical protein